MLRQAQGEVFFESCKKLGRKFLFVHTRSPALEHKLTPFCSLGARTSSAVLDENKCPRKLKIQ